MSEATAVVAKKASIGNNSMQMRVEIEKIPIGLYGDTGSGNRRVTGHGMGKIRPDHLKSAFAELGQQFAIKQKIDPQALGNTENPLAVGDMFEHIGEQPFAVFNHSFLMTGGTKMAPFA